MPKAARATIDLTDMEPQLHRVTEGVNHYYRNTHSEPGKYIPIRGLSETRDVDFFVLGDKRNQSKSQEYALKALCREAGLHVRDTNSQWGIPWNSLKPERLQKFGKLLDGAISKENNNDSMSLAQAFDRLTTGLSPHDATALLKLTAERSEVLPRGKKLSVARKLAKIEGRDDDVALRAGQMAKAFDAAARRIHENSRAALFDGMVQSAEYLPSITKEALGRDALIVGRG